MMMKVFLVVLESDGSFDAEYRYRLFPESGRVLEAVAVEE
jgi:hypothetical protein